MLSKLLNTVLVGTFILPASAFSAQSPQISSMKESTVKASSELEKEGFRFVDEKGLPSTASAILESSFSTRQVRALLPADLVKEPIGISIAVVPTKSPSLVQQLKIMDGPFVKTYAETTFEITEGETPKEIADRFQGTLNLLLQQFDLQNLNALNDSRSHLSLGNLVASLFFSRAEASESCPNRPFIDGARHQIVAGYIFAGFLYALAILAGSIGIASATGAPKIFFRLKGYRQLLVIGLVDGALALVALHVFNSARADYAALKEANPECF